jgi:APA family basic amino acid/polyamine antiporter
VLFVGVNLALIRLRFIAPHDPRPFRAPLAVGSWPVTAVLGVVTSVVLLFYIDPAAWVLGVIMIALGIGAWLIGPYVGRKPIEKPGGSLQQ